MIPLLVLALVVAPAPGDGFAAAAGAEIAQLVARQLMGHYDVESVRIDDVRERDVELGDGRPGSGLRTVRATVDAVRNAAWSPGLNRDIPHWAECERSASLFLLCRPSGYRFRAEIEADLVATTEGWKVLDRHRRSLQRYPLEKYLVCPATEAAATDAEIIACLTGRTATDCHRLLPGSPVSNGDDRGECAPLERPGGQAVPPDRP